MAQSPKSFEDATTAAVEEAGTTVKDIKGVWINNFKCDVENNKITMYRVDAKISFLVSSR
jgi:hypothetical protein